MSKRAPDERILNLVAEGLTNPQIADALGVTGRTLSRWRASSRTLNNAILAERARQAAAKAPTPHGKVTRYNKGCRCSLCREAQAARHYEWSLRTQQFATRYGRRTGPTRAPVRTGNRADRRRVLSQRERIEQAIARGCPSSTIMADFGVSYDDVQAVREALEVAVSA